jgi:hypothetical protein
MHPSRASPWDSLQPLMASETSHGRSAMTYLPNCIFRSAPFIFHIRFISCLLGLFVRIIIARATQTRRTERNFGVRIINREEARIINLSLFTRVNYALRVELWQGLSALFGLITDVA